ncbi:hypothetical protein DVS28_a3648 [Euzebya pacifica]|uniref:Uncharacterized protein n=1 Tax=Euzebya pacifica TaxID=1608957 RepID=A0A346Y1H4_9ACTN|nr:hypothetical protein [Euzebya pacifica]AXV08321.1 hypothetical protein DVS28_a3648 [Euzebya pacifica]
MVIRNATLVLSLALSLALAGPTSASTHGASEEVVASALPCLPLPAIDDMLCVR